MVKQAFVPQARTSPLLLSLSLRKTLLFMYSAGLHFVFLKCVSEAEAEGFYLQTNYSKPKKRFNNRQRVNAVIPRRASRRIDMLLNEA